MADTVVHRRLASNPTEGDDEPVVRVRSADDAAGNTWFISRLWPCLSLITVEPAVFLFAIAGGMVTNTLVVFIYYSRCVELMYPEKGTLDEVALFCQNLSNHNRSQQQVQEDVADLGIYTQLASTIPAFISAPILGAWADGPRGRRLPLFINIAGALISGLITLYCGYFYRRIDMLPLVILSSFFGGITGGDMVSGAIFNALIVDSARKQNPDGSTITMRMGLVAGIGAFGSVIGNFAATYMLDSTANRRYFWAMLAGSVLSWAGCIYVAIFVKDVHHGTHRESDDESDEASESSNPCVVAGKSGVAKARELCVTMFKRRVGWTRFILLFTVVCIFVEGLSNATGLILLLVKRPPFEWTDVEFSFWATVNGIFQMLGMFFWPIAVAFTNFPGQDLLLINFGLLWVVVFFMTLAFAETSTALWASVVLSFFVFAMSPGFRGFIPKLVDENETARVFTALGLATSISPILNSLVFNNIYAATSDWWPGFSFAVCGVLQLIICIGFIFLYILVVITWNKPESDEDDRVAVIEHGDNDGTISTTSSADRPI